MKNLKFSVAISVYKNDNASFFNEALESIIINQTVKPDEVVLIVDGYIPESIENIIHKFELRMNSLRVIRLAKNGGLGNALRIAVNNCSYNLIARMDSDDISIPKRFEIQLKEFEKEDNLDILGGNIVEFIGSKENIIAMRDVPKTDKEIKKYSMKRCPMNHTTVMFKKEAVVRVGNYMDLFWNEDYYLWIRMIENNCIFKNLSIELVNVRVDKDTYKRRGGLHYFKSEKYLQDYMLMHGMIKMHIYCLNIIKRFVVQCLLPNSVRAWVFKNFARNIISN